MTDRSGALTVDARGMACPMPVLRLVRALRLNPDVEDYVLLSDDPATARELASWCLETGHTLEGMAGEFRIMRRAG